jgi:hypothetical protein
LFSEFWSVDWRTRSALNPTEQLYSARGSQSVAVGSTVTKLTGMDPQNRDDYMIMTDYPSSPNATNHYYKRRAIWTTAHAPIFNMREKDGDKNP